MQLFIMIALQLGHAHPWDHVVDSLVYRVGSVTVNVDFTQGNVNFIIIQIHGAVKQNINKL